MHVDASVAAGFVAGAAFIVVFVIWSDEPPFYRIPSLNGQLVIIPEGTSIAEGNFEPRTALIETGDFVEWVNEQAMPATVVIEPACEPLEGYTANVTSCGTEKLLGPGKSFACMFRETGDYHVQTELWPWMRGIVKMSP